MSRTFLLFYYIDVHLRTEEILSLDKKGKGNDRNRELALGYDPEVYSSMQLANDFICLCHSQSIIREMSFLKMNMTQGREPTLLLQCWELLIQMYSRHILFSYIQNTIFRQEAQFCFPLCIGGFLMKKMRKTRYCVKITPKYFPTWR